MVKKYRLASLGAWLIILPVTTAHGAMLEKYQVLEQNQAYQTTPEVPTFAAQNFSLYSDFAKEISNFSPEEKDALYGNFLIEKNQAIGNKEFDKAKYYNQLLGIILDGMKEGAK